MAAGPGNQPALPGLVPRAAFSVEGLGCLSGGLDRNDLDWKSVYVPPVTRGHPPDKITLTILPPWRTPTLVGRYLDTAAVAYALPVRTNDLISEDASIIKEGIPDRTSNRLIGFRSNESCRLPTSRSYRSLIGYPNLELFR